MKRIIFASVLTICLFFCVVVNADGYTDFLVRENIISGDESGFREEQPLLRCEFVKMVNRAFEFDRADNSDLFDVNKNSWYYNDFLIARTAGYVKGDENGRFHPEEYITRAEMAVILSKITGVEKNPDTDFDDDYLIPDWAKNAVSSLKELGIVNGNDDNTFAPNSYLTRGEGFAVIAKAINNRFESGTGTASNPYVISKSYHLSNIRFYPNASYILKNDIVVIDMVFDSIPSFGGVFYGKGHKIVGMITTQSGKQNLFDNITRTGEVSDLKIVCRDTLFNICNKNFGTVRNCANTSYNGKNPQTAKVKGGIADENDGLIDGCYNLSDISAQISDGYVGGICGINFGTVINCFNAGNALNSFSGGIAGINNSVIENCFNIAEVAIPIAKGESVTNCYFTSASNHINGTRVSSARLNEIFDGGAFKIVKGLKHPVLAENTYIGNENFTDFAGGDGSKINPFIITDVREFRNIALYEDKCFLQTADIDFSGYNNYIPFDFSGEYDGNGFKIHNLYIYRPDSNNIALFSSNSGTLSNLHISDCYIEGGENTASIASSNSGIIINCSSDARINSVSGGGIACSNTNEISSSYYTGKLFSLVKGGGIVCDNDGTLYDNYSTATLEGATVGGISAINTGIIQNNCFWGKISANYGYSITVENNNSVTDCYYASNCSPIFSNNGNARVMSRNLSQFENEINFTGLDFEKIWRINGSTYPTLKQNAEALNKVPENLTDFAGGNGTVNSPYRIVTPIHLYNVRKYQNASFSLENDIDLSLVSSNGGVYYKKFSSAGRLGGIFLGNGHTVSGLNSDGGLFYVNDGIISDLTVNGFKISADKFGAFAYKNNGTITKCVNNSNLTADYVGGIAFENNGSISQCANTADIFGNYEAGGISVINSGKIFNCLNSGCISGKDKQSKLFGISSGGNISTCYNSADIYFINGKGEFYPISDKQYNNSYYIDRYNEKYDGALTYKEIFSGRSFDGFDFYSKWTDKKNPVPKEIIVKPVIKESFSGGNGTPATPYLISTPNDLYNIRMYPNASYKIIRDINLIGVSGLLNNGGTGFAPVNNFSGTIDGNGYAVYNLIVTDTENENSGFVGINSGSISNIAFFNAQIQGKTNSGIVCGINEGNISSITVKNSRIGSLSENAGGICGINNSKISGCTNYGDVFSAQNSGGIAGSSKGSIRLCTNLGGIISSSELNKNYSGGICGANGGTIERCVNSGKTISVSESSEAASGGIAGILTNRISDCSNTGTQTAKCNKASYAGGIVGLCKNLADISFTYNTGYSSGTGNRIAIGAIVASGNGKVRNSYYDYTLSAATMGEDIYLLNVEGVSAEALADFDSLKYLKESGAWVMDSDYDYPQIFDNRVKQVTVSDNVRDFAGGNGTIESPYIIMTPAQLDNVRMYLGSVFALIGDINMSEYSQKHGFKPIGDGAYSFFGTFMGNGFSVTGLDTDNFLFSKNHGEIYNLSLKNSKALGISGTNTGLLYRCSNYSDITSYGDDIATGGITAVNYSTGMIISCFNKGDISAGGKTVRAGGVAYGNYGIIAGSYNEGNISLNGSNFAIAGGIASYNFGKISDCYNRGDINAISDNSISGGITGTTNASIVNCYNSSENIRGKTYGGIAGNATGASITNCLYNSGCDKATNGGKLVSVYGKTESELKKQQSYTDFDFELLWKINYGDYPILTETEEKEKEIWQL